MANPKERLRGLRIQTSCTADWDQMAGDGRSRHCAQCDRRVYDFSQFTAEQTCRLIEAHRGRICGRITRHPDGRLVTLPTVEPSSLWVARRASPFAAAVAAAFLTLPVTAQSPTVQAPAAVVDSGEGAGAADRESESKSGSTGTLSGRATDPAGEGLPGVQVTARNGLDGSSRTTYTDSEGRFAFPALAAGRYEVAAELQGFRFDAGEDLSVQGEGVVIVQLTGQPVDDGMLGIVAVPNPTLDELLASTAVVVSATIGPSTTEEEGEESVTRLTTLWIDRLFKGNVRGDTLVVRHDELRDSEDLYVPGRRIIALLEPVEDREGLYETTSWTGLKLLSEPATKASEATFDAFFELDRNTPDYPARLADWLVEIALEPDTRGEGAEALSQAVKAFERLVEERRQPRETVAAELKAEITADDSAAPFEGGQPGGAVLGAFVTPAHRARLTRALLATSTLRSGDRILAEVVATWDRDAAIGWLARRFLVTEPDDKWEAQTIMDTLAEALGDEALQRIAEEAREEFDASYRPEEPLDQTQQLSDLHRRFRAALGHGW